jgi:ABC-type multidrug transport system ATPase subunit
MSLISIMMVMMIESGGCWRTCPVGLGGFDCQLPLCGGRGRQLRLPPGPGERTCRCDAGWTGVNCNVCADDLACRTVLPRSADPVCYSPNLLTPQGDTFQSCAIMLPDMYLPLLGKKRLPAVTWVCNNAPKVDDRHGLNADSVDYDHKGDPGAGTFECTLQFWLETEQQFRCQAHECYAPPDGLQRLHRHNETLLECRRVRCECLGPTVELCNAKRRADLSPVLETVRGPMVLQCHGAECLLVERTLADYFGDDDDGGGMRMRCTAGTCLDRSQVPRLPSPLRDSPIGLLFLLALALPFLFGLLALAWSMHRYEAAARQKYRPLAVAGQASDVPPEEELRLLFESSAPVKLEFADLTYSHDYDFRRAAQSRSGQSKWAVSGVGGVADAGQVLAIIGGSGAGKTTLLRLLSGQLQPERGVIRLNGQRATRQEVANLSSLVPHDNAPSENDGRGVLSVRETLMFAAFLKLPTSLSLPAKALRVQQCLRELGIEGLADRIVDSDDSLSGGERKRVSIARALLTAPRLLFLDEPTTGLDTHSAFRVMEALVRLARRYQRTVVVTLHQPRSNIFSLLDRLTLLGQGHLLYAGEAHDAAAYFAHLGFAVPAGFNTADYLVDITMDASVEYSQGFLNDDDYGGGGGRNVPVLNRVNLADDDDSDNDVGGGVLDLSDRD